MTPSPETLEYTPSEPEISSRELEREEILDRLERRADVVISMQKELSEIAPDFPDNKFLQLMHDKFEEQYKNATSAGRQGYDRAREILFQRKKLYTKLPKDLLERSAALWLQEQEALENDEARFLWNIRRASLDWVEKHKEVSYFDQHREVIPEALRSRLNGRDLDLEQVAEIRTSGIEMTFVLKNDYYNEVLPENTDGIHFIDSPWSFARSQEPADTELTIRHESMHNFLDGAPDVGSHFFQISSDGVEHSSTDETAATMDARNEKIQRYLKSLNMNKFIDGFQHELLAGLERVELETFTLQRSETQGTKWINDFFHYVTRYSTAGHQAWNFYRELNTLEDNLPKTDDLTRSALTQLQLTFIKRFAETVETIRTCVERAQTLDTQTLERVHAMFMILPPSKYRHVSRYLDSLEKSDDQPSF